MKYKSINSKLYVYNDWSTDYDNEFLEPLCDNVVKLPESNHVVVKNESNKKGRGVQLLRWYQFREFLKSDFDLLYFTDSDAIHDINFEQQLISLYKKYTSKNGNHLPICLYDTIFHSQTPLKETNDVFMRKTAPGISHLYDKEMVQTIVNFLDTLKEEPTYGWDYYSIDWLKRPCLTTKISFVEHFGAVEGSMHTPTGEWDRDRAKNPTKYLLDIRKNVIDYLEGKVCKPNI